MADNVVANAGSGGATFRSFSDGTDQWPATIPAYVTGGSAGTWTVQYVEAGHALPVQPGTSTTWAATQSGTWNITNISGTISLPTGAATAAKQPALGTAGTASSDVITIQGIASMTAVKVDGSGVTQPVSGTVTATLGASTNAGATAKTSDYDTGAGTDTVTMFGIALPASGGAVQGGTATNPIQVSLANTAANSAAVKVDGSAVTQPVSGTFWQATQPVSAASLPLPTGASTAAKQPALGTAGTASSDVITVQGIASMTALKVDGSAVTQPVSGTVTANPKPVTSGGLSIERVLSAASTNATSVKAGAGQLYSIYCHNINAAVRYVKLYNKASAPTVGTDTPVLTLPVPGNANGAGFVLDTGGMGIAFGTGIALAITTGVGDSDTGAVAANDVIVNMLYA